ncbi:MAG: acyl-CoA dehydrogenase family protein [Euryarchaeota archaeon]|nr:acyl-CoA dehydrogenase family protein [Euryarchaeota archaeon]
MVDFEVPREVEARRQMAHAFARGKLRPISREYDEKEHEVPWGLIEEVFRMERAMAGKEKEGEFRARPGAGRSLLLGVLVTEELVWGDGALMLCLPGPQLGGAALAAAGTEAQKRKFMAAFQGDRPAWGAMAMTEPGSGSDTASIRTTARRDGDEWVLNGEKIFCTSGGLALEQSTGWVVAWARLLPPGVTRLEDAGGHASMRAFIVPAGTPGVRVSKVEKKMGIRASNTVSIVMEDARLPLDHMLGWPDIEQKKETGGGFKAAMATFDGTRPIVASASVGLARAALDMLRDWLKKHAKELNAAPATRDSRPEERGAALAEDWEPRWGLSPHQLTALEADLQRMEAQVHAARLLAWRAAWLADQKKPNALEAAMAKAYSGKVVTEVTQKCCELAGPEGYTCKLLLEKLVRDSKINDIFEGTGQINTLIVARRVLGYTREQLK